MFASWKMTVAPARTSINVDEQFENLYHKKHRYDVNNESATREMIIEFETFIREYSSLINFPYLNFMLR